MRPATISKGSSSRWTTRSSYAVIGGASFDYPIGVFHVRQTRIMLDARYAYGLTNVFDAAGNPEAHNGTFSFSLGFAL